MANCRDGWRKKKNNFEIHILDELVWNILSRLMTKSQINQAYRSKYAYWKREDKIASISIDHPEKFHEWINNNPPGGFTIYLCAED